MIGNGLGVGNNVAAKFRESVPDMLIMWCVGHKLELWVLDAVKVNTRISDCEKTVKFILKLYDKFHTKNHREVKAVAAVLDEVFVYLPPINMIKEVSLII